MSVSSQFHTRHAVGMPLNTVMACQLPFTSLQVSDVANLSILKPQMV